MKAVEAAHEEATHVTTPCQSKENCSQCIVATVLDVFDVLQSTSDLSPMNAKVDKALTALVSMVLVPQPTAVVTAALEDAQVRAIKKPLWHYLSEAEYEMESWWARRFLAQHVTMEGTSAFWYRENYKELTALELAHLQQVGHRPSASDHVVFVGGGPLPFSAIEYMLQSGAKITVVEQNPWAVQLSTVLIKQLGLKNVAVEYASGERFDYKGATHLIVAALVRHDDAVIRRAMDTADLRMIGVRPAGGTLGFCKSEDKSNQIKCSPPPAIPEGAPMACGLSCMRRWTARLTNCICSPQEAVP